MCLCELKKESKYFSLRAKYKSILPSFSKVTGCKKEKNRSKCKGASSCPTVQLPICKRQRNRGSSQKSSSHMFFCDENCQKSFFLHVQSTVMKLSHCEMALLKILCIVNGREINPKLRKMKLVSLVNLKFCRPDNTCFCRA